MSKIEEFIKEYGPWNAHSVEYEENKFTFGSRASADWLNNRGDVYAAMIQIFSRKPIDQCRVLDIGCCEGGLTYQFAKRGAHAIGLEMRDVHLGRCRFLNESFPRLKMEFVKGDMLALPKLGFSTFDFVLLAGTLYHVDAPDIVPMLKTIRDLTATALIIDTHIAVNVLEYYYDEASSLRMYGRSLRRGS